MVIYLGHINNPEFVGKTLLCTLGQFYTLVEVGTVGDSECEFGVVCLPHFVPASKMEVSFPKMKDQ